MSRIRELTITVLYGPEVPRSNIWGGVHREYGNNIITE